MNESLTQQIEATQPWWQRSALLRWVSVLLLVYLLISRRRVYRRGLQDRGRRAGARAFCVCYQPLPELARRHHRHRPHPIVQYGHVHHRRPGGRRPTRGNCRAHGHGCQCRHDDYQYAGQSRPCGPEAGVPARLCRRHHSRLLQPPQYRHLSAIGNPLSPARTIGTIHWQPPGRPAAPTEAAT